MLLPKRTKYRKQHKLRNRGTVAHDVSFGEFGLKATGRGRMTARQIEAARRAMTRHMKRAGKVYIRVFPDKPITKSHLKCVWVKVKVALSTGLHKFSQAVCCMKLRVFLRIWHAKHLL